jgi:CRISPR-associated protein Csb1
MSEPKKFNYSEFDKRLDSKAGPVMIVGQQLLKPPSFDPEFEKEIIFPPSYAGSEKSSEDDDDSGESVYNIDPPYDPKDPATHKNVCVLDSIPSQANRMEPLFKRSEFQSLVPQYQIRFTEGADPINILDIGHRIADSAFRGTTLRGDVVTAFKAYAKGDASPMAKLGPTSLLFGVWDSRGTGVKVPRLINSIIRAFNVVPLRRSAQYTPPINYNREGLLPDGLTVKPTKYGLAPVPAPLKIGGIQVNGDIRRDFSLNIDLLRRLKAPLSDDAKKEIKRQVEADQSIDVTSREDEVKKRTDEAQRASDQKLQRYILGLALLAFTATPESTLRQGCQLLPKGKANWKQFDADGEESGWNPDSLDIAGFASAAASDFGVVQPPNQPLVFDKTLLKASIEADAKKKADKKTGSVGIPIDNLKKLVNELEPARGDKFSEAKTKPLPKLQEAVAAIEADSAATDELKVLVAGLKPLLIADAGSAARKIQMLALFPVATVEQSAEAPTETAPEATEEAAQ